MQVKGRKLAAINHTGGTFMPVARRQFTTLRSAFVTCINFIGRRTSSANRRRESGPVITREDVSGSKAAPSAQFFSSELNIVLCCVSRAERGIQRSSTRVNSSLFSRKRNSFISTTAALDYRRFNRLNNNVQPGTRTKRGPGLRKNQSRFCKEKAALD